MSGTICEVCEQSFDRQYLKPFSLSGRSFIACETCFLQESVAHYRLKFESEKEAHDRTKLNLNLFKSVMLKPNTMASLADEPTSEPPSKATVRGRLQGIESFTIDQMQFWLETYELYARAIAEELGKKYSVEERKKHLKNKTEQAIKEQSDRDKKRADTVKAHSTAAAKKHMTPEDKAIRAFMSLPGMTEEKAKAMLKTQMDKLKEKGV